jgi:N-formylglutamate amidohydrolase
MAMKPSEPIAYARLGQVGARSPLVIAVPHAGRHYPPAMLEAARLPRSALETIEDRYADLLVSDAVQAGAVAMAVHGIAILLDCHSMPSLAGRGPSPRVVVGDRHGRSAATRFVAAVMGTVRDAGLTVARNHPYAGGHTLDLHGQPRRGRHAIQIEVDRSLYLDPPGLEPGPGLAETRRLVQAIAAALEDEARGLALAAE